MINNGTRLQSQVCDTQVIVVRAGSSLGDLRAGGAPMVPLGTQTSADVALNLELSGGNRLGQRYVDGDGAEVLVTKSGRGTLTIGDKPLQLKEAKALPASD
jgi:hypothetical protein